MPPASGRKPGTGDDVRLHQSYDLRAGHMEQVQVTDRHQAESLAHFELRAGDVVVTDAGYPVGSSVEQTQQSQSFLLQRTAPSQLHLEDEAGRPINLKERIKYVGANRLKEVVGFVCLPKSGERAQARAATVVANEDAVICKLSEPQLEDLGQRYGDIWRYFARELVRRLAQRNALVNPTRENIGVCIMSSTEALDIAQEIKNNFAHDSFSVVIWTDGMFRASSYAIESLERAVDASDFAIVIAQPDDLTNVRGEAKPVPRDNIIFELGFFIGCLGRKRTLLLEPRDKEVKLPADLSRLSRF